MLLWTPLPIESVMEGYGESKPALSQVELPDGGGLLLIDSSSGRDRIWRVLSTNPFDYLRPELAPGQAWAARDGKRA